MALAGKIPPQSLEAEMSVLGSILLDPESFIQISDFLNKDDFYSQQNATIYEAMYILHSQRKPIDLVTLPNALESKKQLEGIGGIDRLIELSTSVPSASHIFQYANIIKEKSTLRKMIQAGQKIAGHGYDEDKNLEELLESAEKEVFAISQTFLKDKFISIKEILSGRFDLFSERHDMEEHEIDQGISTGYEGLNKILGGFQPSDMIVLAARPSMGKTALCLNFALNAAVNQNKTVGIFSLEMSKEQLVDRIFSSRLEVDSWKMQKGKLSDTEFQRMGAVMDELSKAPIFIDDTVGSSIPELRAKTRRLQMEHGLDMIIIDYLQLMSTGRSELMGNRVQEISEISRSIKALARELHVPIIALSQLSRGVEARPDKRPGLSDLRDSGAIEQDADVVMMIYRDDYYNPEDSDTPGVTEIFVRKHRNGPIGSCDLRFDKAQMKFFDIDNSHDEY